MSRIHVGIFWMTSRGRWYLRWKDPGSGKRKSRQTDICKNGPRGRIAAERLAQKLQDELDLRHGGPDVDPTFESFLRLYHTEHLVDTSRANRDKWNAAVSIFDAVVEQEFGRPIRLSEVTPLLLSKTETEMRRRLSAGSISSYMATLRGGFNWAASMELMRDLPRRRSRGRQEVLLPAMRLQPISEESLEDMCDVCPKLVGKRHAVTVRRYLRALWLSGCRMTEPVEIHSSRLDCHRPLELDSNMPRFCWVSHQKNRTDQIQRITLDFAAYVRASMKPGYLFRPTCETGELTSRTQLTKLVSTIGEKANVIAEPGEKPKTATAKHFRSSFVTRWSLRGMPIELIQSMVRHANRSTTERYYLGDVNAVRKFDESEWVG